MAATPGRPYSPACNTNLLNMAPTRRLLATNLPQGAVWVGEPDSQDVQYNRIGWTDALLVSQWQAVPLPSSFSSSNLHAWKHAALQCRNPACFSLPLLQMARRDVTEAYRKPPEPPSRPAEQVLGELAQVRT